MNHQKGIFLVFIVVIFSFSACVSDEIGNSKDVNPDAIYFDYRVWGEEGVDNITINLQYRMGGPHGTTLVLEEPAKVELDGEVLKVDSAKFSGAYYETQKPVVSFSGKHRIKFTDLNEKEYQEEFDFAPFTLEPEMPALLKRGPLSFQFKGLKPEDRIRVLATDTSFESMDINEVMTVQNGRLMIPAEKLNHLTNGPIHFEFYKEQEQPVKNATREGGTLLITYGLRRDTELRDQ